MTASSPVKRLSAAWGKMRVSRQKISPAPRANFTPTLVMRRMGLVSFRPQYWLPRTLTPMPMPPQSCCRMNWIWFTRVAPERASSV